MNQTKLSKGPPTRLMAGDPRNFAVRRLQGNIKLPGEASRWIIYQEQNIIEDYILSMKDEPHKKHFVKPKENNFFTRRFMRL